MTQAAPLTAGRLPSANATCGQWNRPIDVLSECAGIQTDWDESEWQHRRIVAGAKQQHLFDLVRAGLIADSIVVA
jgi:hypothetical protein